MKLIQPNCRLQFTAEDIDFILSVLGNKSSNADVLIQLLADEETRDLILDNEDLLNAFLDDPRCLRVSSRFYFYVLVRHVLRRVGIDDRDVADYVAELLCEFSREEQRRCALPGRQHGTEYFFEMLSALQEADDRTRLCIRAHIGNEALFLAGVFLDRVRYRAEYKGFPDVSYYDQLGEMNFRVASDHRLAERYSLAPIYATLAERFQTARLALNDVADRFLFLGDN